MRYGLEQTLSDANFAFLEKIRNPIFLVRRDGRVERVNEAGRKFLKISRLGASKLDEYARVFASAFATDFKRIPTSCKHFKVFSRSLKDSDYVLVEIYR